VTITPEQRALLLGMSNKNWRSLAACEGECRASDAEELVRLGLLEKRQHHAVSVYRRTLAGRAELGRLRPPRALERRWRGGV
jgi:hypothetical protein